MNQETGCATSFIAESARDAGSKGPSSESAGKSIGKEEISWYSTPLVLRTFSLFMGLVLWSIISLTGNFHPSLLPPPWQVATRMFIMIMSGELFVHIGISLTRVLLGFLLSVCLALPVGIAMGLSKRCQSVIEPIVELFRPIPPLALIPLAVIWFGIGMTSKLFLIAYGSFFAIVVNTMAGMKAVDPIHIRAAQSLGASPWQILLNVTFRAAVPDIVVGLRLGMGMAFLLIVGSEMIAAHSGLGYLVYDARFHFMGDIILVGMVAIGVLGFLLSKMLVKIESKFVAWRYAEGKEEGMVAGM